MILSQEMVEESTGSAHQILFNFFHSQLCAYSSAAAIADSITCVMVPEGVKAGVIEVIGMSPPIQSYGHMAGADGDGRGSIPKEMSSGFMLAL